MGLITQNVEDLDSGSVQWLMFRQPRIETLGTVPKCLGGNL
jgi:hypothetical protein